jgi:S-(hydroxymethyl)glutathione dehydrogenase/alcohol dehydrogenase
MARELGATDVIHAGEEEPLAALERLFGPDGLDFCVEAAGRAETIEQAFRAVRRNGGLCVFASHPPLGSTIRLDPFELISGKRILGSWGGSSRPDVDVPRFAELYRKGILPLARLLSEPYPLEAVNRAMADLAARRVTRALLAIDPELTLTAEGA